MRLERLLTPQVRKWGLGVAFGTMAVTALLAAAPPADWPMFGQNLANTAGYTTTDISAANVGQLTVKWALTTTGDVSARAAVVNGVAYFPDWGPVLDPANPAFTGSSTLWAVHTGNGRVRWSRSLSDYGLTGSYTGAYHSRTTPAVVNGVVYIGTQEGAHLLAIDAASGNLLWRTQLESTDPYAIVTTSPAVANGIVLTGVASLVEGATIYGINVASAPPARGSAVAVNAITGALMWKTYMVPTGYSGGGVWGSNPTVSMARKTVYVATGNNYRHPDDDAVSSDPNLTYGQCIAAGGTAGSCNSPDNHVDAVVALDLNTGAIKWSNKLVTWNQSAYGVTDGSDDWNVDCLFMDPVNFPQCPSNPGPDYDFGSTPNLITYHTSRGVRTILGAGQKSGIYYAMDPDTGAVLWQTQVGPGSSLGGMEWGSATDGKRIYVSIANFYGIPHLGGFGGSWAALEPATGQILWQTADPNGAIDIGGLTVGNGVVYAASMAGAADAPNMFALDAVTGPVLWQFAAGSSVNAGASIVGDTVFWGSGYAHLGVPGYTPGNTFYAFKRSR